MQQFAMNSSEDRFNDESSSLNYKHHLQSREGRSKVSNPTNGDLDVVSQAVTSEFIVDGLQKMFRFVKDKSLTQFVKVTTKDKKAITYLKELHAGEVKEAILEIMESQLRCHENRSTSSTDITDLTENFELKVQKTNDHLLELTEKISTRLREKHHQKHIYKYIGFQWNAQVSSIFLQTLQHQTKTSNCFSKVKTEDKIKQERNFPSKSKLFHLDPKSSSYISLVRRVGDKNLAGQLFLHYENLLKTIQQKQLGLDDSTKQNQDLTSLLAQQVKIIDLQNSQNYKLHQSLAFSNSQLDLLKTRCSDLESELKTALQTFQSVIKEQKAKERQQQYYMNPLWDKAKLQQKYMSQIIQLESDLCLQKYQTNLLVDLVTDQIRQTHKSFYELGASTYFISKYDLVLGRKLKLLKAFDKVNLQEVLTLKEDSMFDQGQLSMISTTEMHRSTISTYSSVQTENKHCMVEEETFEGFNNA